MRLHERTLKVQGATATLRTLTLDFAQDHDLTDIEMIRALGEAQDMFIVAMLRAERHPGDPDKKADEA